MKAILLALLLISQSPKSEISLGIGISGYYYDNLRQDSGRGLTLRLFYDYWVRDFLAFGIDFGYQRFWAERTKRNYSFIPNIKLGTTEKEKNRLFISFGYGLDVIGMELINEIIDESRLVYYFGAGYIRDFTISTEQGEKYFHVGLVFNDIYIKDQDVCFDGCMADFHIPSLSFFVGFGK